MKHAIGNERYQHYSTDQLLNAYIKGPERIDQIRKNLTVEDLKAKPLPNKWSILEILIHVADAELVGACRFRLVLSDFPGNLPFYSQDEFATKLKYNNQSEATLAENLLLFKSIRQTTYGILQQCNESDWRKSGIHPERGPMSLRALLELYADHSERHIEQILTLRKLLGKPLEMEILLKDRLY